MRLLALTIPFFVSINVHAQIPNSCEYDPEIQKEKSAELARLVEEDQADRAVPYEQIDWNKVNPRDLARRIRVATIFAEGCFKTAADYGAAAMVYQHGNVADHYYQAFVWAMRAVQLGDDERRWLTAAALDRYLVKTGRRQLFGTQYSKDGAGNWCLQPVEKSFPEEKRLEYVRRTLRESIVNFLAAMKLELTPQDIPDCEPSLQSSPKGSVPGFW